MSKLCTANFTSNGTWTCPAGVTKVFLIGQGGGQGGTGGPGFNSITAPGGNGTTPYLVEVSVVPNTTYTITIGAGGSTAAGSNAGLFVFNASAGGDTTFGSVYTFKGATYAHLSTDLKGLVLAPGASVTSSGTTMPTGGVTGYTSCSGYINTTSTSTVSGSMQGGGAGAPGWLAGAGGGQGGNGNSSGTGGNGSGGSGRGAGGGGGGAGSVKGGSGWSGVAGQLQIAWIE